MLKKLLKYTVVVLLTVLLLGGMILSASGSSIVYLMSVNNRVFVMTAENMPVMSGGQLYIPYTMVSKQFTGIDLGVNARYSAVRGTLTVTDGIDGVVFDIKTSTANDIWGKPLQAKALVRGNMVFIPIQWLCGYFDQLRYSLFSTPYGILVRLMNGEKVISDERFVDAADDQFRKNIEDYRKSIATPSAPVVSPTPTPTVPPTPTPTVPPEPVPEFCLAFRWGDRAGQVAELLEAEGLSGLFLMDNTQLVQQDDLVRRLIARGHQVGLLFSGDDMEQWLSQLEEGRQLMRDICRSGLFIVSVEHSDDRQLQPLLDAGCAIWPSNRRGEGTDISGLIDGMYTAGINYVELTCGEDGFQMLKELLLRADYGEVALRRGTPLSILS